MTVSISVLCTSHNRVGSTIACLESLSRQAVDGVTLKLYLTDDGSSDGTSAAVRRIFPEANIALGTGDLFWAAGMALAESKAVSSEFDYLLWLNDDCILDDDALERLLAVSRQRPMSIVVGALRDPSDAELSYGGKNLIGYHPQRFIKTEIRDQPQDVDTFNGNLVLIPVAVHTRVGRIDGAFSHAYADEDYGLRARKLGIQNVQVAGSLGSCARNPGWSLRETPISKRFGRLESPTGLPLRSQYRYLRRHSPLLWPVLLIGGYIRRLLLPRK